jgi:hypothetical protein
MRIYKKPREWEDFYQPMDFLAKAHGIAKGYCNTHKVSNKQLVYNAANEAAFEYDTGAIRCRFRLYVEVKIRTAIYNNKEDNKKVQKFSQQLKEAVILDRMNGIPAKTVAEQQGLTVQQVYDIYNDYKKKVKREVEAAAPAEQKKIPYKKPEIIEPPKVPEAYPGQIHDDEPVERDVKVFLPHDIVVKPINVFAVLLAMQQFIDAIAEGAEITETAASAGKDAHVSFSFGGVNYGLELRRIDS